MNSENEYTLLSFLLDEDFLPSVTLKISDLMEFVWYTSTIWIYFYFSNTCALKKSNKFELISFYSIIITLFDAIKVFLGLPVWFEWKRLVTRGSSFCGPKQLSTTVPFFTTPSRPDTSGLWMKMTGGMPAPVSTAFNQQGAMLLHRHSCLDLDIFLTAIGRIWILFINMVFHGHLCLSAPTFLDGTMERADVTDLYPWMEYQFRIIAVNEYGSGEASIPSLKIKTWDAGKNIEITHYCCFIQNGL